MAFILQHQTKNSKGILVFKHLEVVFFNAMSYKKICQLREKYLIGLYFGTFTRKKNDYKHIDFYIGEDNVIEIDKTFIPRLNLNGYNFLPESVFINKKLKKQFDFIFIGDPSRNKRLSMFIDSINKALDQCNFSVLIINRIKSKSLYSKFLNKIVRASLGKMDDNKRSNITYFEVDQSMNTLIPRDVMPFFIESSKCLVTTSLFEGAARVVAESLSKGLNVISFIEMKGATNNHLHKDYDLLFHNENDLVQKIIFYIKNFDIRFANKSINYKDIFSENKSKEKLKLFLEENFKDMKIDKENLVSIKLTNSFQSHNTFLPRYLPSNKKTDECLSFDSIYRTICYLTENPTKKRLNYLFKISTLIYKVKLFLKQLITKIIN